MTEALALPAELTIYHVATLRAAWLAWLNAGAGRDCRVDGSGVDEVDAAGLQLLLALARSARDDRRSFAVENASATLGAACAALGLADLLAENQASAA